MNLPESTKPAAMLAVSLAAILTARAATAQQVPAPQAYPYGPGMMGWGGWYGMILGPLFMILVLAAVIAVTVLLVRWIGGPSHAPQPPHSMQAPGRTPIDILKERYARGEIDKEEYEERRRVIGD